MINFKKLIIDVLDFPKSGINFKDITPLLADGKAFNAIIKQMTAIVTKLKPDIIVAPEARGFIFATPIASNLKIGFVPIRKSNKLPREVITQSYELEYSKSVLAIHKDAILDNMRVVIVDDLLASGGTIDAILQLIQQLKGKVVGAVFAVELLSFKARKQFTEIIIESLIKY